MTVLERLAPAANSTGEPGSTDKSGVEARAIEALLVCIARFGLSKTTLRTSGFHDSWRVKLQAGGCSSLAADARQMGIEAMPERRPEH